MDSAPAVGPARWCNNAGRGLGRARPGKTDSGRQESNLVTMYSAPAVRRCESDSGGRRRFARNAVVSPPTRVWPETLRMLYPLSYRAEARVGLEPTTVRLRWTPGRQSAERSRPDEGLPGDRSATVTPRARRRAGSRTRTSSFTDRRVEQLPSECPRQESNAPTPPDDVISTQTQGFATKSGPRNDAQAAAGGAKSGAVSPDTSLADPDLARIVASWPALPEPIRRAMLALVQDGSRA